MKAKSIVLAAVLLLTALLPSCALQKFEITFKSNGGTSCPSIFTRGNETLDLPQPERYDYKFLGWFFDDGGWNEELTKDFFLNKSLTENITVYANWMHRSYYAPRFNKTGSGTYESALGIDLDITAISRDISAEDYLGNSITHKIQYDTTQFNKNTAGTYTVNISVMDDGGNSETTFVSVTVKGREATAEETAKALESLTVSINRMSQIPNANACNLYLSISLNNPDFVSNNITLYLHLEGTVTFRSIIPSGTYSYQFSVVSTRTFSMDSNMNIIAIVRVDIPPPGSTTILISEDSGVAGFSWSINSFSGTLFRVKIS